MLKKVNLDGIEYEAEESVIKFMNAESARADNAEKELSSMTAERDNFKERADKAESELAQLKENTIDKSKLDEAVNSKINLLENAKKAGVELKGDESDEDLKKAIITKVFPKANLDGKDEAYIQARYDGAVESLSDEADTTARQALGGIPQTKNDGSDDARDKMIARLKNHGKEE